MNQVETQDSLEWIPELFNALKGHGESTDQDRKTTRMTLRKRKRSSKCETVKETKKRKPVRNDPEKEARTLCRTLGHVKAVVEIKDESPESMRMLLYTSKNVLVQVVLARKSKDLFNQVLEYVHVGIQPQWHEITQLYTELSLSPVVMFKIK